MEAGAGADYSTCALTLSSIMGNADYALTTHAVPCPTDVCVAKCNATGEATGFQCYNTSVLMDATQDAANNRGLAMGCPGSHGMNATFMAGKAHGDCEAGHVQFCTAYSWAAPPSRASPRLSAASRSGSSWRELVFCEQSNAAFVRSRQRYRLRAKHATAITLKITSTFATRE